MFRDETGHIRELWLWLGALSFLLLFFGCLALMAINAGPGFGGAGQETHMRLASAVTNYPFCPPSVPCPISVILPNNHWVVWIMRESRTPAGVVTSYRKLVDVPLWY